MNRHDFRCLERLRVRWAEVDAQGIVFNGHYLMYADTAIGGYWRALAAVPYAATMARLEGDLYMRKAVVEYHASARYDDVLDVGVRCERVGTSSLSFAHAVFRRDQLLVSGEFVYVFADPKTQTSKPVPPLLREALRGFEAGEPMIEVRTGAWDTLGADAHPIRKAVFVEEQGIPAEREWDHADPTAVHAVAYSRLGQPVATGRLIRAGEGVCQIGRMAVIVPLRGREIGRRVLDALTAAAAAAGYREVVLHAQASAAAFYRRSGFVERGPVFEEVGIPHVEMVCRLGGEAPGTDSPTSA